MKYFHISTFRDDNRREIRQETELLEADDGSVSSLGVKFFASGTIPILNRAGQHADDHVFKFEIPAESPGKAFLGADAAFEAARPAEVRRVQQELFRQAIGRNPQSATDP